LLPRNDFSLTGVATLIANVDNTLQLIPYSQNNIWIFFTNCCICSIIWGIFFKSEDDIKFTIKMIRARRTPKTSVKLKEGSGVWYAVFVQGERKTAPLYLINMLACTYLLHSFIHLYLTKSAVWLTWHFLSLKSEYFYTAAGRKEDLSLSLKVPLSKILSIASEFY
jgi:hypothetical protein